MPMHPLKRFHQDMLGSGYKAGTVNVYMYVASRFLDSTEKREDFDRHDALDFFATIRESGAKPNYLKMCFFALKGFYNAADCSYEGVKILDESSEEDIFRPALEADQIRNLIHGARKHCTVQQRAILAVSTTYGVRRSELCAIEPRDVTSETIAIRTMKKKKPEIRTHLIPDQIRAFITAYSWNRKLSSSGIGSAFKEICAKAGVEVPRGYNWHSIRRSLVTEFDRAGVSLIVYHNFMRWSKNQRDMTAMPLTYARYSDGEVDAAVFAKHPFLDAWLD